MLVVQRRIHRLSSRWFATQRDGGKTIYTIDSPATDKERLRDVVIKHCLSLDRFLSHKPIANHNYHAFTKLKSVIPPNAAIVLDSGCGTGLSTRRISSLPCTGDGDNTWVLGVDRSLVRLERNRGFRTQHQSRNESEIEQRDKGSVWKNHANGKSDSDDDFVDRVLWMRVECVDLWRLIMLHRKEDPATHWNIKTHYLLYPNPYPKTNQVTSRWYGHPSFPLILQLGGDIVVRSNWETYLDEFAQAVLIADEAWADSGGTTNWALPYVEAAQKGPVQRLPTAADPGWSNFEIKYDHVGEATFELTLTTSAPV
jgi:tRNA (guanine-N7-)-methyltransferase